MTCKIYHFIYISLSSVIFPSVSFFPFSSPSLPPSLLPSLPPPTSYTQEDGNKQLFKDLAVLELLQSIRSNHTLFAKYQHTSKLVQVVNSFARIECDLPAGWEKKVDPRTKKVRETEGTVYVCTVSLHFLLLFLFLSLSSPYLIFLYVSSPPPPLPSPSPFHFSFASSSLPSLSLSFCISFVLLLPLLHLFPLSSMCLLITTHAGQPSLTQGCPTLGMSSKYQIHSRVLW